VGCFLVNDDYGIPTSLPWAMKFPLGLPPSSVAELTRAGVTFPANTDPNLIMAVHPTQLYETAIMMVAFAWLWSRRAHLHATGWLFGAYLVWAGIERFIVELVRAKDDRLFGPISLAQVTSVALVIAGAWWMQWCNRPGAGDPSAPERLKPKAPAPTTA
jgi:phosphatidylglycerol:prolipoprotein diacylglycerol transferase